MHKKTRLSKSAKTGSFLLALAVFIMRPQAECGLD